MDINALSLSSLMKKVTKEIKNQKCCHPQAITPSLLVRALAPIIATFLINPMLVPIFCLSFSSGL
jgi:hypothetical protein